MVSPVNKAGPAGGSTYVADGEETARVVTPPDIAEPPSQVAALGDQPASSVERLDRVHPTADTVGAKPVNLLVAHRDDYAPLRERLRSGEYGGQQLARDIEGAGDQADRMIAELLGTAARSSSERAVPTTKDQFLNLMSHPRWLVWLVDQKLLSKEDVVYDVGSGSGVVCMLLRLLSDAKIKGIEIDADIHAFARERVDALGLDGIDVIHGDACAQDVRDGTFFYMFSPFQGQTLHRFMAKLEAVARERPITVCFPIFGSFIEQAAPWLHRVTPEGFRPGLYRAGPADFAT